MPSKPPIVEWISASLQKAGNRPHENEDAAATGTDGLRFAVSDGATEGWESGRWATHLASAFVSDPPAPADFPEWVSGVRQSWVVPQSSGPVAWYASEKQEEGSFATLVGVELRLSKSNAGWVWRALAIGDSCLLHVRSRRIAAAFPLATPAAFGNQPLLIPSSPALQCPAPAWQSGRGIPGDTLWLATDAVAVSLLTLPTPAAWEPLLIAAGESFQTGDPAALIGRLHTFQTVKNDDMTVIAIRLPDLPELP
jgi:hypothetical protein